MLFPTDFAYIQIRPAEIVMAQPTGLNESSIQLRQALSLPKSVTAEANENTAETTDTLSLIHI